MPIGLIGRKCGMTRVFTEAGESIPVSVIAVPANRITQLKTADSDGYCAVQVAAGAVKSSHVNKPMAGHFAKANVEGGKVVREYRVSSEELDNRNLGDELKLDTFNEGQAVDVCGISKGKGFAGVIKRHNFHMQDATHGNSLSHRAHGSTGQCQTPGRVHKGKKMAGQMGNVRKTVQNQKIVKIDQERNLLLIRGAIPGAPGGNVVVMPSVKAKNKAKEER